MTILKERGICNMANLDLTKYGITGTTEIVHNPSYELLFEEETKPELVGYEKGQVSELGAVNVIQANAVHTEVVERTDLLSE